eukprot:scaffold10022_cov156-Skeletonema_marinoi.AAC.32
MSNHGNPNRNSNTTSQIKQAENLAAFLSDWSNLLTPSSAAETKTETAMGPRQRQPFSPRPPAVLPLPLPSGRTLRRRSTFTNPNSNDEGGGGGGTSTDDIDGDGGAIAIDSIAVNFLRSSSLTLHEHEQQATHQNGPSYRSQRQMTTDRNGIAMPKRSSPLCTRAVLHEEILARSGGGGIGILPLPFARSAVQTHQHQSSSSTSASNSDSRSRMTSPPLSRDHQEGKEEQGSGAPSARSDPST